MLTVFLLFSYNLLFAQSTWKNDKAHSKLTFQVSHLSVSDDCRLFKDFDFTIHPNKPDFRNAVFSLSVDVASINTEVAARDKDLRSDHFFDVTNYPIITFINKTITMNLW